MLQSRDASRDLAAEVLADPAEADAKGEVERLSREQLADIAEVGFVKAMRNHHV